LIFIQIGRARAKRGEEDDMRSRKNERQMGRLKKKNEGERYVRC
jgi:hypothetical protein